MPEVIHVPYVPTGVLQSQLPLQLQLALKIYNVDILLNETPTYKQEIYHFIIETIAELLQYLYDNNDKSFDWNNYPRISKFHFENIYHQIRRIQSRHANFRQRFHQIRQRFHQIDVNRYHHTAIHGLLNIL